jgi:hypothetical protein
LGVPLIMVPDKVKKGKYGQLGKVL